MPLNKMPATINIALMGGGDFCAEILQKTTVVYQQEGVKAPIVAVADQNPHSPGMQLAQKLGLITLTDYRQLYTPEFQINLIVIVTSEETIFKAILESRPAHIRIMSYPVFEIFWQAISTEERKLRERNEEMDTILNAIQDFILVLTPEMEVIEANEAFMTKMGYSYEEVIGRKCYELFWNLTEPCFLINRECPLNQVIRNKRPIQHTNSLVNRKGELRHFEIKIYPIWEKNSRISKFVYISQDVTQRIQEEEEITHRLEQMVKQRTQQLQETHAKLLHQDKMASLGKLSASMVHEINNPIAGILNLIMLIKRMIDEDTIDDQTIAQFTRYLGLMEKETRRISRIVNNLLAFSRQHKIEFNRFDLARLIDRVLLLNANLLKINGIKIEKHLPSDLPEITGSEDQLQQVFMNIISNAAESMESADGGVLRIDARCSDPKPNIIVEISDTGVGIPSDNFSKLFEPFFTTKKKGKGIGLGLSVAYGIVKEHGGSIFVDSQIGKGTTFRIALPFENKEGSQASANV